MNRLFAFVWLVVIGSNVALYYSKEAAYNGAVILGSFAYVVLVFHRELLRLVLVKEFLLSLSLLAVPLLLMLVSDRSFERGMYTSQVTYALVFIVSSVLALRADLDGSWAAGAFVIVAVGAALNLYELFIENNVWSGAPGRSAGLYGNPNISGEALLGYGVAFLTARTAKLSGVDLIITSLVFVGVFATFSRAGILATLVLLTAAVLVRIKREYMTRILLGLFFITLVGIGFAAYVIRNVDLSADSAKRVQSLLTEGGVGDYGSDRGVAASLALDVIAEDPVFGAGVHTIYEMAEGPHNMFLALMVDYGIFGLAVYLLIIARLISIGRCGPPGLSRPILFYVSWLVIFSFASHNLLGEAMTIPLLGFAIARAYRIQASAQRSWVVR